MGSGERERLRSTETPPCRGDVAVALRCVIAGLFATVFLAGPAHAAPPFAAPAWRLSVSSQPTNLVPGEADGLQGFFVTAINVGAASTTGTVTLVDTLPEGLSAMPSKCEVAGPQVTCDYSSVVRPGGQITEFIPVNAAPSANGRVSVNRVTISGGGAEARDASVETRVGAPAPAFGFLSGPAGAGMFLSEADGAVATRAGSVPYQLTMNFGFPSLLLPPEGLSGFESPGHPRDLAVDLPTGMALDPAATPRCSEAQLALDECPADSQVGEIDVTTYLVGFSENAAPLYNMQASPGSASNLAFDLGGLNLRGHLIGSLHGGEYGLSAAAMDIPAIHPVLGIQLQLWGDPSDAGHDAARGFRAEPGARPFITMPSACGPLLLTARADSWEEPGTFVTGSAAVGSLAGEPIEVEGCSALAFEPALTVQPTTAIADSPSGLEMHVAVPQRLDQGRAASSLRAASLTLPAGMVLNAAAVSGRDVCTPSQIGLDTPIGVSAARFDDSPASCPDAAKIGTVEASTPLLQNEGEGGGQFTHPLSGSVYLAQPHQNPFGSTFALYVAIDDPESGVVIKLASKVEPDPASGRLKATLSGLPQLPFEEFKLDFFNGPRAALRTPTLCGESISRGELSPWSGAAPAQREDRFAVEASPAGGHCATTAAEQPNAPRFDAGTLAPGAGRSSPFVLHLSRADGSQEIGSLNLALPPGLTGVIAGTPRCSYAALAAAAAKSASKETANPSCPGASRIGRLVVGLGAGPAPLQAEGSVYLAGSYRGAPLSLAVVTPATAGPFDLGTVVVRAALFVDPTTGQLSARSDPFPRVLAGVPLDVRTIALELTKPGLIQNPTSCEPRSVSGEAISVSGQPAPLQSRFQVGECARLGFDPKLSIGLSGALGRNGHPALRAVLGTNPKGAALAGARFGLPPEELLDLRHLRGLCPRGVAADECPPSSRLGSLRLDSPALEEPLEGAVYMRVPRHRLPDLTAEVRSGPFRFLVRGRTIAPGGRLGISLDSLPDLPLSKAVLSLAGGSRGIVVNARSLCAGTGRATVHASAHNGTKRRFSVRPRLGRRC